MLSTSSEWDSLSARPGDLRVVARIYYGDESSYISVCSAGETIKLGSEKFFPAILNIPRNSSEVKITRESHSHSIAAYNLKISNHPWAEDVDPAGAWGGAISFSDLVENANLGAGADVGIRRRKIDCRYYLSGISSFTNCFPFSTKGIIVDVNHDRETLVLMIEDLSEQVYIQVPTGILAESDYPLEVQDSIGRPKARIYGDHILHKGDDDRTLDTASAENNLVKLEYLGLDADGDHRYFVADHVINEINNDTADTDQQQIWGYDSDIKRPVRLATEFTVEQNTAAGCIISVPNNAEYFDYWYPDTVAEGASDGSVTFSNTSHVIDRDFTTYGEIIVPSALTINDYGEYQIEYPDYDNQDLPDASISDVTIAVYWKFNHADAADADFDARIDGGNGDTALADPTTAAYPDTRATLTTGGGGADATKAGITAQAVLQLFYAADATETNGVLWVYETYKIITYTPRAARLDLYFGGKGAVISTDLDDRSTADLNPNTGNNYLQTHANDDDSGDQASNPGTVFEIFIRNVLEAGDADLDLDLFNYASNDYGSMVVSGALTEFEPSADFIFRLAAQFRSILWNKTDGQFGIKVIKDTYASADMTIDYGDLISFKPGRLDFSQLITACEGHWQKGGAGGWWGESALSQDTNLQSRHKISAARSTDKFWADFIGDTTTGDALRDWKLKFWKHFHNAPKVRADKYFLKLDIGDTVSFTNVPRKIFGEDITAAATRDGDTIYPYFMIFKVDRGKDMYFEALQLHNTS